MESGETGAVPGADGEEKVAVAIEAAMPEEEEEEEEENDASIF